MKLLVGMTLVLTASMAPSQAAEPHPLRVLCWNPQHGVGEDGKLALQRIAVVIRNAKSDLVALQEMDKQCGPSGKIDQRAELAKLTGMHCIKASPSCASAAAVGFPTTNPLYPAFRSGHRLYSGGRSIAKPPQRPSPQKTFLAILTDYP